jgi:hypothetical protein
METTVEVLRRGQANAALDELRRILQSEVETLEMMLSRLRVMRERNSGRSSTAQ